MKWTKVFSRETVCISCWCKITQYKYRVFTVFNMYSPLFPWCILSAPIKYFKIINQSSLFWDKKSTLRVIEQAKYTLKKKNCTSNTACVPNIFLTCSKISHHIECLSVCLRVLCWSIVKGTSFGVYAFIRGIEVERCWTKCNKATWQENGDKLNIYCIL